VTEALNDLPSCQGKQVTDLIYLTGDVAPGIAAQVRENFANRGINLAQFTVVAIHAEDIQPRPYLIRSSTFLMSCNVRLIRGKDNSIQV
jgi:hypothetical protein